MLNVEKVFNLFLAHGVDFFTGVPDSLLKNICAYITDHASAGNISLPPMKVLLLVLLQDIIWLPVNYLWCICKTQVWVIR